MSEEYREYEPHREGPGSSKRRDRGYGEKQEKLEKQDEKEEKSWEEKWRRDPLNVAAWALILIWAGLVLAANNMNLLRWIPFFEPWSIFFLGAGGILFLEVVLRLVMPAYRQPVLGNLILAVVFVAIALGDVITWKLIWPLVLIGLGVYLLFVGLFRRRE